MRDFSKIAAFALLVLLFLVLASSGPSFGLLDVATLRVLAVVALVLFVTRKGGGMCRDGRRRSAEPVREDA